MWLDRNQFPVNESLVCLSPTDTQVKNQSCLTGLHLPSVLPLGPTNMGNHYLGMGSTYPLWVSSSCTSTISSCFPGTSAPLALALAPRFNRGIRVKGVEAWPLHILACTAYDFKVRIKPSMSYDPIIPHPGMHTYSENFLFLFLLLFWVVCFFVLRADVHPSQRNKQTKTFSYQILFSIFVYLCWWLMFTPHIETKSCFEDKAGS
jgi:hypothetical protein